MMMGILAFVSAGLPQSIVASSVSTRDIAIVARTEVPGLMVAPGEWTRNARLISSRHTYPRHARPMQSSPAPVALLTSGLLVIHANMPSTALPARALMMFFIAV